MARQALQALNRQDANPRERHLVQCQKPNLLSDTVLKPIGNEKPS